MKHAISLLGTHLKEKIRPFTGPKEFLHQNVPYFCQWESRDLAADFLSGEKLAINDPRWKDSGASTREEYSDWSWSGCGMACLKMVLAHRDHKTIPLVALGKQCLKYGGYTLPLETSPGLYYKPFVTFLREEYGITARIVSPLTINGIVKALSERSYVIASVNPAIRHPEAAAPKKRSGHLVLILGYNLDKKVLYLNNPSGDSVASQEYAEITFMEFKKFFSNRGIVISGQ